MDLKPSENMEVIIPDPGLREFGGHHPASIISIASYFADYITVKLTVYCNKSAFRPCIDMMQKQDVNIVPFFKTDFYADFYNSVNYSTSQQYIRHLAMEYFDFFCSLENKKNQRLVLFHTLNWQHASALSLVLQRFKNSNTTLPKIIVFLMYNPVKYHKNGELDLSRQLNFLIGFKSLSKYREVSIYAADHEVSTEFGRLLGNKIDLHPCYLTGLTTPKTQQAKKQENNIILYAGDAKANKGFLSLPKLVKSLAWDKKFDAYNFVIQYTLTNENPDLKHIEQVLMELSNNKNNVILINSFMSRDKLNELFNSSVAILFNYDSSVYKNQSSGLLWLAAFFRVKVLLLTNTWLMRESKRLGISAILAKLETLNEELSKLLDSKQSYKRTRYAEYIFQDFAEWLTHKVTSGEKNEQ